MSDPRLSAAAAILGQPLAGLSITGGPDIEFAVDLTVDEEDARVWAKVHLKTGDVYELSTRWVAEESP